jgi:hypothetical protein
VQSVACIKTGHYSLSTERQLQLHLGHKTTNQPGFQFYLVKVSQDPSFTSVNVSPVPSFTSVNVSPVPTYTSVNVC